MLDIRRLEVLSTTLREGSIAGAARALAITPSAASQALSALEAQTGAVLLERLPRGVRPTAAGERLAAQADAVLSLLTRAESQLDGRTTSLRVAAFPTAIIGLLPAALVGLRETAPDLHVEVVELEPDDGRAALRSGDVDVALVNHHAVLAPDTRGPWRVHHVVDEPVLAALPRSHRLAAKPYLRVEQLRDDNWVMQKPASPCQDLVQRVCGGGGFAPTVVAACRDYRAILAPVGAGVGVSLVPQMALAGVDLHAVATVPLRPAVRRRTNALVSTRPGVSLAAAPLLDQLTESAAASGY
jgi:DNA-binding transcriptional LysR family regulator